MKTLKILGITIAIIFSTVYVLNLEYFIKGIRVVYLNGQTTVFIDDLKYFDYETIKANDEKFPWNESENLVDTFPDEFEQINKEFGTVAYVVIHKDTIIAEKYPEKINADKMQDIIAAKSQHNEMRIYDVKKLIIPIKDES